MSAYDPFIDDSAHVSVGRIQMRIGYLAHCLGIPAATLSALRSGEMVAVESESLRQARRTAEMSANIMRDVKRTGGWEGSEKVARQFERIAELLAAAKDARHD